MWVAKGIAVKVLRSREQRKESRKAWDGTITSQSNETGHLQCLYNHVHRACGHDLHAGASCEVLNRRYESFIAIASRKTAQKLECVRHIVEFNTVPSLITGVWAIVQPRSHLTH